MVMPNSKVPGVFNFHQLVQYRYRLTGHSDDKLSLAFQNDLLIKVFIIIFPPSEHQAHLTPDSFEEDYFFCAQLHQFPLGSH